MSRFQATVWSHRVDLSPADKQVARKFIGEELRYYNALVEGLSGPCRSMPDLLRQMTGRIEMLFGEVAAACVAPAIPVPEALSRYADVLVDEEGNEKMTPRMMMVMDVAATPAGVAREARRAMATAMLAQFREQAAALAATLKKGDQVYRFPVDTLTIMDGRYKRHLQMPRSAIQVTEDSGHVVLRTPYVRSPIRLPKPPIEWTMIVLRDEDSFDRQGPWVLEFRREQTPYLLRLTDTPPRRKRVAVKRPTVSTR